MMRSQRWEPWLGEGTDFGGLGGKLRPNAALAGLGGRRAWTF